VNQDRLRKDEEMKRTYVKYDEKKEIERLDEFVKEFHEAFLEVDFISVFDSY